MIISWESGRAEEATMRRSSWAVYLAVGFGALAVCALLPPATAPIAAQGICLSGVIAMFVGIHRRAGHPARQILSRRTW